MRLDWKVASYVFLFVSLFSGLSRVGTSFDSRWAVYIAMSIWQHGDTNLDEYLNQIRANDFYAVECVSTIGAVSRGETSRCNGHFYNAYPIGGPVLTAPLVLAVIGILKLASPVLSRIPISNLVIAAFFRGDFDKAHALIEVEAASILLGITAVVVYFIGRRYLPWKRALILAVLFGIATPAYSTAGRALWQHTPSMLLLAVIVLMLLKAEKNPALAAWVGIPVALSYTVRPTDSLFVAVFTLYVWARHRPFFLRYLVSALPIAIAFLAYNFSIYHEPLSPYYRTRLDGFSPDRWPKLAEALAGNLVSPSRGLFVYTPVFLFSAWGMLKGMWKTVLTRWLGVLAGIHWIAVSSYVACWWAGMCYGPRFFTDLTPIFVLFLIPYFLDWEKLTRVTQVAFIGCVLVGFGMHLRGGWSPAVYEWNVKPASVDQFPRRNWDWSDPPFLR